MKPRTILVVDDELIIRDLLYRSLTRLGYNTIIAAGGQQAVDIYALQHAEIDLVILDLLMPQLDGLAALDKMREINPDVTAIISSGHLESGTDLIAKELGAAGILIKPYLISELSELIEKTLGSTVA